MSENNYILDLPLPLNQDFKSLKNQGLGYIQEYSGNEWTNLNPSDPGVTILDQLCFALTELGYCNDFPIADILTTRNEKLQIKDQFYLPEEILTTSPVTIEDYRKYIIDAAENVDNVMIPPATDAVSIINRAYQPYLLVNPLITEQKKIDNICMAVLYALNKRRNVGEMFLEPLPLVPVVHVINGRIEIENQTDLTSILNRVQIAIADYIFPTVTQNGYQQLNNGPATDEIFNGPLLVNGWISSKDPGEKKDIIRSIDLVAFIKTVPGILSVAVTGFDNLYPLPTQITAEQNQVLVIDVLKSAASGSLEIICKGKKLNAVSPTAPTAMLSSSTASANTIVFGTEVNTKANLPRGKFRDIDNYYSIQNTFPEIFLVGNNALTSKTATPFQIAQSRQLKGYLLLFDQVLANQFSQLASIDRLLSFKNAVEDVLPGEIPHYAAKDVFTSTHHKYPVPYMVFSPTYFCQPLYDVPNIKPLLKDHDIFKFSIKVKSEKELEQKAWIAYKKDPYNSYIKGMMDSLEDEATGLVRRDNILDHLLARHGESPLVINQVIEGSLYTGNNVKDRVIFKSLYLQNFGLLSYFRNKAYNYNSANKISSEIPDVPIDFEQKIFNYAVSDFIFNSTKIDRIEKLTVQDFTNYSALELKLGLLFGFKMLYRHFIVNNYDDTTSQDNLKLAFWMIRQRKGSIFIETNLLFRYTDFSIILTANPGTGPYWQASEKLSYAQAIDIDYSLSNVQQTALAAQLSEGAFIIGNTTYPVTQRNYCSLDPKLYKSIPGTGFSYSIVIQQQDSSTPFSSLTNFHDAATLILPGFIPQLITPEFQNRLQLFVQTTLPVSVPCGCHFVSAPDLEKLIPAFVNWHNDLLYHGKHHPQSTDLSESSGILAALLIQIQSENA